MKMGNKLYKVCPVAEYRTPMVSFLGSIGFSAAVPRVTTNQIDSRESILTKDNICTVHIVLQQF